MTPPTTTTTTKYDDFAKEWVTTITIRQKAETVVKNSTEQLSNIINKIELQSNETAKWPPICPDVLAPVQPLNLNELLSSIPQYNNPWFSGNPAYEQSGIQSHLPALTTESLKCLTTESLKHLK